MMIRWELALGLILKDANSTSREVDEQSFLNIFQTAGAICLKLVGCVIDIIIYHFKYPVLECTG